MSARLFFTKGEDKSRCRGLILKSEQIILLKILTQRVAIDPVAFPAASLTMSKCEKLRLYTPVAKSQTRSNFLTYRKLLEFKKLHSENESTLGLSVQAFQNLILRKVSGLIGLIFFLLRCLDLFVRSYSCLLEKGFNLP